MHMPHGRTRRPLALFALALALFAALPCAALSGEDSCCGAAANCGEAGESPCTQLAAAPCCEAPRLPLDTSTATPLPGAPTGVGEEIFLQIVCGPVARPHRPPPAALKDHATIRDVVLRL